MGLGGAWGGVKITAHLFSRLFAVTAIGCLPIRVQPATPAVPGAEADRDGAPGRFGFSGLEIYKVDENTSHLRCADLDGDGRNDLILVNNARGTLDLFFQKSPDQIAASQAKPVEYDTVNEILSDARFRKETILTEKRVFDLIVRDLNGDGQPDLAYYGDPRELVVVYRTKTGWSDAPWKMAVADGRAGGRLLAAGDLNGDGRVDLALLALEKIRLFYQREDGKLAEPVDLFLSEKELDTLEVADVDGDGREDLVLAGSGPIEPVRVRLQGPTGLGPEIALELAAFRTLRIGDLTGDGRSELSVVHASTGRLAVYRLESAKVDAAVPLGRVRLFPLRGGEDAGRQSLCVADVDGDGRTDVLVTYPSLAQFHLQRQGGGGGLLAAESFPSLAASTGTCVGDLDGDGRVEVVVLSPEERAIGVTRWDGARLVFPKSLPLKGRPACAAMADLDGRKGGDLAVVVEGEGGKTVQVFTAGEPLAPLGEPLRLDGAKDLPRRIAFVDANRDGRPDLLVFFPYEAPRVYLNEGPDGGAGAEGLPRFVDASGGKDFGRGLLQGVVPASLSVGDIDGDGTAEFLLAKKAFARAFRVVSAGALDVVDQFNARDPGSNLVGTACVDLTGDGRPEIVLLDGARARLWVLGREPGSWNVSREIRLPSLRPRSLEAADLDGDGRSDLIVHAEDRFGVLFAGGSDFVLRLTAQYESELKDVRLDLLARGDLDGDGRPEVVVTELRKHLLEVLALVPGRATFDRGLRFKMFEEKGREGGDRGGPGREPRDVVVADVTGDGRDDVVLLAHDRLLVYPGE